MSPEVWHVALQTQHRQQHRPELKGTASRGPGRRQSMACLLPAHFREHLLGKQTTGQVYPSDTHPQGQGHNSELDLSPRQDHCGDHGGVQQGLWVGFRQS